MDQKIPTPLEKPQIKNVSLKDLEARLKDYEVQYGFSSKEFYKKVKAGLLDEQDAFITWLGCYEAYLRVCKQEQ